MRRFIPLVLILAAASAACHSAGAATASSASPNRSAAASTAGTVASAPISPSPTRPAVPTKPPKRHGAPSPTCVKGWTSPAPGTPAYTDPLGIIRRTSPVPGPFTVVDIRYFEGPESPPSDQGYILDVGRWYVKLFAPHDLTYQGRFLVESRRFGRGVSAVAPYDTRGFRSPDWTGFQWNAADPKPRTYPGLPGTWAGIPYDFVKGGEGLTFSGLPPEVAGCLKGT